EVAMELERIALHEDYFISKKLYPNIDFYSGITLKAMSFPTTMFTVLFALARTVGWIAQWKEMIEDPHQKIGRPRQLYTGATQRRVRADPPPEVPRPGRPHPGAARPRAPPPADPAPPARRARSAARRRRRGFRRAGRRPRPGAAVPACRRRSPTGKRRGFPGC